MKFVDEFRDDDKIKACLDKLHKSLTQTWTIMEVCGGQTHSILRHGLDGLLPQAIRLLHGPGCPVCVTPASLIDQAIELSQRPNVILCSFGDMLRVPGARRDLFSARADGGDVRTVYSPLDCLNLAQANPDKEVVFFAVGFETTAPANGLSVLQAKDKGICNYSLLVSQVLVPPALEAILNSAGNEVQGFLAAGHVCSVMGFQEYESLAEKYGVPMVVTGFEPLDIVLGVARLAQLLELGQAKVENQYARAVQRTGNVAAQRILKEVFSITDREWRGIGCIPNSGLQLAPAYEAFDAVKKFELQRVLPNESSAGLCISGEILMGKKRPHECPEFGKSCTPNSPLGATMVSSEGACAAYYQYRRVSL